MLAWINKWHVRIDSFMASLSASLILFITALGTIDVLGRYLFNKPIAGTYEAVQFAMAGIAFFAFAYVQYLKGHITVPLIRERLSGKTAAILDIFFLVAMLATFILITWYGGRNAIAAWRAGDTTIGLVEFPVGPAKLAVPIGGGLLCLRLLSQICGAIAEFGRNNKSHKVKS